MSRLTIICTDRGRHAPAPVAVVEFYRTPDGRDRFRGPKQPLGPDGDPINPDRLVSWSAENSSGRDVYELPCPVCDRTPRPARKALDRLIAGLFRLSLAEFDISMQSDW